MIKNFPPTMDDARDDMLVRVASMYYEREYSQQRIASILNISRSNVSRLLKEAKDKGLVEIKIHKRLSTVPDLESWLLDEFGLKSAVVLASGGEDYQSRLANIGQIAAWHLADILEPQSHVAISWGTGVSSAVQALTPLPELKSDVAQMIGSVGRVDSVNDGPELARILAGKLGGDYHFVHAPLFVDSQDSRRIFLQQPIIKDTLAFARDAQYAICGVGTTAAGKSSFLRAQHLSEDDLTELRNHGAVGETCGLHFDIDGNTEPFDINQRVISLTADEIRDIPHKVTVACGLPKVKSIIGALRGGYVNVLATDDITARAILELLT